MISLSDRGLLEIQLELKDRVLYYENAYNKANNSWDKNMLTHYSEILLVVNRELKLRGKDS